MSSQPGTPQPATPELTRAHRLARKALTGKESPHKKLRTDSEKPEEHVSRPVRPARKVKGLLQDLTENEKRLALLLLLREVGDSDVESYFYQYTKARRQLQKLQEDPGSMKLQVAPSRTQKEKLQGDPSGQAAKGKGKVSVWKSTKEDLSRAGRSLNHAVKTQIRGMKNPKRTGSSGWADWRAKPKPAKELEKEAPGPQS